MSWVPTAVSLGALAVSALSLRTARRANRRSSWDIKIDRDVYDDAPARPRSDLSVTVRNAGHTGVRLGILEVTLGWLPRRPRYTYSFDLATRLEGGESQTFAVERTSPTDDGKEPAGIRGRARLSLESGETVRRRVRLEPDSRPARLRPIFAVWR